jgi:hypothetical protein
MSACGDDDEPTYKSIYGKWEVYKYDFTFYDEQYGWRTQSEYPYNEGYYEEYTFKRDHIYYYLYEDDREMELFEGKFQYNNDFLILDNLMYSTWVMDDLLEMETTYQGQTTHITLQRIN